MEAGAMRSEDEIEVAEMKQRHAERELRNLKQTIRDDYARAALTGLLAYGYSPRELVVEEAFKIADVAMERRI
jgi:hypothetical protein